jgi:AAA+ ATPase superfamily predicted ATPase
MNSNKIANPFVIGKYVSEDYFCDRTDETAFLKKQVDNERNTAIIAPRRLGKTGLIHHFFAQPDIAKRYQTIFIDIYATNSLSEFVYLLGNSIYKVIKPLHKKWAERFFGTIKSLRPGFKLDAATGEPIFDIGLGSIEQPQTTIDEIFDYLEAADKPCIVAIDEFQQITNYTEINVEALLRTKIQQCKQTLFIFSGSRRHLMNQMFNSPSKPFYQSVITTDLKPLDKIVYIAFAKKLFADYGKTISEELLEQVYDDYEGVTWYMQMIMNELFALTEKGDNCKLESYPIALKNVIQTQESSYKDTLSNISAKQKPVLFAIAKEGEATNVTSVKFLKDNGLSSSSSVQSALKGLLEKDIITRTENGYRVYDYFFAEWLVWNY